MKPPYVITNTILGLISSISECIGEIKTAKLTKPHTNLRRLNRIKTIQSSLEIEGNTLSVDQVTDLINNKRVIAPQKDIIEMKNAVKVYSMIDKFDVYKIGSLLKAHSILMKGLVDNPGKIREKPVGIIKGKDFTHLAPSGDMVYPLLNGLFEYLKKDGDLLLIKSCVFHYEFEFIHPFMDGNGRIGRLWQTMILKKCSPVFEFLPIELIIKERQKDYYQALAKSDNQGNSTEFIEFMLDIIKIALNDLLYNQNITFTPAERIDMFRKIAGRKSFSRKEYLRHNKDISTATASRDLKDAVNEGVLERSGYKNLTRYRYKM